MLARTLAAALLACMLVVILGGSASATVPSPEPTATGTAMVQLEGLEPIDLQFAVGVLVFVAGIVTVGTFTSMQRGE